MIDDCAALSPCLAAPAQAQWQLGTTWLLERRAAPPWQQAYGDRGLSQAAYADIAARIADLHEPLEETWQSCGKFAALPSIGGNPLLVQDADLRLEPVNSRTTTQFAFNTLCCRRQLCRGLLSYAEAANSTHSRPEG
jgi:hypothetical protein